MNAALNSRRGRAAQSNGNFEQVANDLLLSSPAGAALFARLSAATIEPEFFAGRDEHVRCVCLTVMRARGEA